MLNLKGLKISPTRVSLHLEWWTTTLFRSSSLGTCQAAWQGLCPVLCPQTQGHWPTEWAKERATKMVWGGQHLLRERRLRKQGLFSLGERKESFEGPTRNLPVLMKRLLRRWSLFTDMRGHRTGQRSQTEIGDVQTGHKEKPFHREDSQTLEQILPTKVTRASPSEVSSSWWDKALRSQVWIQ